MPGNRELDAELDRVASALGRVLRSEELSGADEQRFVPLSAVAQRLTTELGRPIDPDLVRRTAARGRAFQLEGDGVRVAGRARGPAAAQPQPQAMAQRPPTSPDILYHACTAEQVEQYVQEGLVRVPSGRPVFLSDDESQAWRAAHRMGGEPRVLYVDTARQRRKRLHLQRNRRGLYLARQIPLVDVLNLRPDFAEQLSAGGIPVTRGPDGQPRMALIRVTRRSGVTWEVAKGKLEPGEPPEWAGVREVQEEMGIAVDFHVRGLVGLVRYGFLAPGGLPRLKTVFLYLLEPKGDMDGRFAPSEREGIKDVRWFTLDEACKVVTHSSLRPLMKKAKVMAEAL
jgi:RNA:NAD 2'-phosphotransferase (TPT1/KptA family)/8-oxo-dGTP pyrophosphatase MutT (NUDIX family)